MTTAAPAELRAKDALVAMNRGLLQHLVARPRRANEIAAVLEMSVLRVMGTLSQLAQEGFAIHDGKGPAATRLWMLTDRGRKALGVPVDQPQLPPTRPGLDPSVQEMFDDVDRLELGIDDDDDDIPPAFGQDDDDDGDVHDEDDDEEPEIARREPDPPAPARMATPAHRQAAPKKTEKPSGTSFWVGKSREELNREAEQRSLHMSNTKEGSKVRGLPTADDRSERAHWTTLPTAPRPVDERPPQRRC